MSRPVPRAPQEVGTSLRQSRRPTVAYVAVALAAVSWGTWGLIVRRVDAIRPIPPAMQSAVLFLVLGIVSWITSFRDRGTKAAPTARPRPGRGVVDTRTARPRPGRGVVDTRWRARAWVAWFGVSDALNVSLYFAAYKITIAPAVLTHYLTPILVALAAPLVLRERMTPRTGFAVVASLSGLALMLAQRGGGDRSAMLVSAALGAASAVFYASNVLVNKLIVDSFSTSEANFWHCLVAVPLLAAFVPREAWGQVDPRAVGLFAFASIGPGALAGLAFVWGLRKMPAAHASTLTLLEPLVSILLGTSVLGERLNAYGILGAGLILTGAAVVASAAPAPRETAAPELPSAG